MFGVQNHYSLIDREWEKNGLLSWCKENGIQFWAWAVLEEGVLTEPKQKDEKFAIMKAIYSRKRRKLNRLFALMEQVGAEHDMTIPQVAISFVANKGIVPICGCRKPYQVEQLGVAADTKLSEAEMKDLEAASDELNVKIDTGTGYVPFRCQKVSTATTTPGLSACRLVGLSVCKVGALMLLLIERFYRIANPFTCTLPGLGKVVFITRKSTTTCFLSLCFSF